MFLFILTCFETRYALSDRTSSTTVIDRFMIILLLVLTKENIFSTFQLSMSPYRASFKMCGNVILNVLVSFIFQCSDDFCFRMVNYKKKLKKSRNENKRFCNIETLHSLYRWQKTVLSKTSVKQIKATLAPGLQKSIVVRTIFCMDTQLHIGKHSTSLFYVNSV